MEKTNIKEVLIKILTPSQAREFITQNYQHILQHKIIILDVRTPEEYNTNHFPNSLNLDFHSPTFSEQLAKLDKTKTYLVHCRSGGRSTKSIEIMLQLHFRYLYNVQGFLFPETQ